jgi:dTDP-4-dehydrorhamnose 3,5-epimerase
MRPPDNEIQGVIFKELKSHPDQRGFFREVVRVTDSFFSPSSFAQWSHSKMTKNVVKAWHYHRKQTDWWYVPMGNVEVALFDNRPDSVTYKKKLNFRIGENDKYEANEVCFSIPPGVLHGCKVLSDEAHLFYITSQTYNPNDEGRFPFNDPIVPHNWGDNAITNERDRVRFEPRD